MSTLALTLKDVDWFLIATIAGITALCFAPAVIYVVVSNILDKRRCR